MASPEFVANTIAALDQIQTELKRLGQHEGMIKDLKTYVNNELARMTPQEGPKRGRFDTKTLKLAPWTGDQKQFKTFENHLKEFIRRESGELFGAMEKAEKQKEPIKDDFEGISSSLDSELRWLLVNYTTGEADTLVRRLSNQTGLET